MTADESKTVSKKNAVDVLKTAKTKIKEKKELIDKKNEDAEVMEKKIAKLKECYEAAVETTIGMRHQITDTEERLEQISMRQSEMDKRLGEKLELLREVTGYKPSLSIEIAPRVESRLSEKTTIYNENHAKFLAAKEKKKELETELSMLECKSHAMKSKIDYLNTELHHAKLKKERLNQEKKQLEELKASSTTKCKELEEGADADNRKVNEAKIRVSALQESIESKEDEILSMSINRKKLEGTIVNILTKIKDQHQKHRYIDVAYTLNKDSFVK